MYIDWEFKSNGHSPVVAWAAGLLACALIGVLTHLLVMRRLRRASPLARIVATLGVLIILQAGAVLRYGSSITFVTSELPVTPLQPWGIKVSLDRLILVGIAAVLDAVAVGAVPVHEVRDRHDGGGREPAGGAVNRFVARLDRER